MNMHSQGLHHNFINSTWSEIIQYNLMQLPRMVSHIHHSLCVCVGGALSPSRPAN